MKNILHRAGIVKESYLSQYGGYPILESNGLRKHIEKRHPECLDYVSMIPDIIESPDYIGQNPLEDKQSFELVKILADNVLIGIKFDFSGDYFYVATLHTITPAKLQRRIESGRLKKFDF